MDTRESTSYSEKATEINRREVTETINTTRNRNTVGKEESFGIAKGRRVLTGQAKSVFVITESARDPRVGNPVEGETE